MTDTENPSRHQAPSVEEFDHGRLEAYLKGRIQGLSGAMRLEPLGGGQSNPTYVVSFAGRDFVLRKQPTGELLPSAHAVDREYRVITALAGSRVPVPETLLLCDDREVIGTLFYVMERVHGRVFNDSAAPGVSPKERAALWDGMNQVLARLHGVDWRAAKLADFGKPGNYFARQTSRWTRQWRASKTRDIPDVERLIEWLPDNLPEDHETTIVHGDYRLGNLMFDAAGTRVVALLDWELSTLGHPLADLAYNCMPYHTTPEEYGGILGLDQEAMGFPGEQEYIAAYCRRAGRQDTLTTFHLAFALFRFAVIIEGIAARAVIGTAAAGNAGRVGRLSPRFAKRACELIDGVPHDLSC